MILLLKNDLNCQKICEEVNKLINRELKGVKDFSNYALAITVSKVVDEEKIKLIPAKEIENAIS
jgi:hypothetical protein